MNIASRLAVPRRALLGGAVALPWVRRAAADPPWPNRPVRVVVPFGPGGPMEPIRSILAERFSRQFGQPFVIENRPGATGTVGAAGVARAAPDGHTLLLTSNSGIVVAPLVLRSVGFDPFRDFAPIAVLQSYGLYLVVNPALPVRDVASFLDYARANPGKLNYTSPGTGSGGHLATEMFCRHAGIAAMHVAFSGTGSGLLAIVRGDAHFALDSVGNATPLVTDGKLRGLAVTGAERAAVLPNIPTLAESGFPEFQAEIWIGLFGPAGLPAPIVARLNEACGGMLADPEVRAALLARGYQPGGGAPAAVTTRMRAEAPRWAEAVRLAGVEPG